MKYVAAADAIEHENSPTCTVYEYGDNGKSDIAKAIIDGRYPERRFALNEHSDMTVFVISGTGRLVNREESIELQPNDALFINSGDPYYFEGKELVVCLYSNPPWSPAQYSEVE